MIADIKCLFFYAFFNRKKEILIVLYYDLCDHKVDLRPTNT